MGENLNGGSFVKTRKNVEIKERWHRKEKLRYLLILQTVPTRHTGILF